MRKMLITLILMLAPLLRAKDVPRVRCDTRGRDFHCVTIGAEALAVLPLWQLNSRRGLRAYGLEFSGPSPERWTELTVDFFSDVEDEIGRRACVEVARVRGRANFRECTGDAWKR
jgi:hypothetical protein